MNASSSRISAIFDPSDWSVRLQDSQNSCELIFGWFFVAVGLFSTIINVLILLAISKFLRYKNVLFLIIANFAVIDLFKALSAIYMGTITITSFRSQATGQEERQMTANTILFAQLLQTSALIFNIGNITSVFNLVVASINEFLFMRLPFRYKKLITRQKVGCAIAVTWILSVAFSVAKTFNAASNSIKKVWVGPVVYSSSFNNSVMSEMEPSCGVEADQIGSDSVDISTAQIKCRLVNESTTALFRTKVADIKSEAGFTVALMTILILCLLVVMATYISLYVLIRRSANFAHHESGSSKLSQELPPNDPSNASGHSSIADRSDCANNTNTGARKDVSKKISLQSHASLSEYRKISKQYSNESQRCQPQSLSIRSSCGREQQPDIILSAQQHQPVQAQQSLTSTNSGWCNCRCGWLKINHRRRRQSGIGRTKSTDSQSSQQKYNRRSLLKRSKAVIVIMTVCGLYTIYLAIYFALLLMHMQNIYHGVPQDLLYQRYMINFVLRALYFIQAAINPFLFFRIRSFRHSFMKLIRSLARCCCKKYVERKQSNNSDPRRNSNFVRSTTTKNNSPPIHKRGTDSGCNL